MEKMRRWKRCKRLIAGEISLQQMTEVCPLDLGEGEGSDLRYCLQVSAELAMVSSFSKGGAYNIIRHDSEWPGYDAMNFAGNTPELRMDGDGMGDRRANVCQWRKEDDTGRVHICANQRMTHPSK